MITATFVKVCNGFKSNASLYKLSEPVEYGYSFDDEVLSTTKYVIVSAVTTLQVYGDGPETYIFPADEEGEIIDWGEMGGSLKGTLSHSDAIESAGWHEATR